MSRPVTLYIASSLDGFIARRDGSIDWLPQPEKGGEDYGYADFMAGVDTVVMGRKTYDCARELGEAAAFPGRRCIVFSRRRGPARRQGVRFVAEEPAEFLRRLRARRGGGIWLVGGGEIARECLEAGVVNTLVLTLVPVLLGDGVPLFLPRGGTTWLQLRASRSFERGLVQLTYDVAAHAASTAARSRGANQAGESCAPPESRAAREARVATAAFGVEMVRAALRRRAA
jgi:dihydrofolate reductase